MQVEESFSRELTIFYPIEYEWEILYSGLSSDFLAVSSSYNNKSQLLITWIKS